jgi:predicted DNA-binding transcriptional regulator AlpA
MRYARLSPSSSTQTGDVLVELGTALIAFGTALQRAGTRLQANQLQPAVSPQAPTPGPPTPVTSRLPAEGYVRIWDIIGRKAAKGRPTIPGMIPVSSATWYAGVKSGRFPKPIKLGGIAMWRVEDIRALVAQPRRYPSNLRAPESAAL